MKNINIIVSFLLIFILFFNYQSGAQSDSIPIPAKQNTQLKTADTSSQKEVESKGTSYKPKLSPPSLDDLISVEKIIWSILFFIVGLYLIKLVTKILELFAEKSTNYRITIKGIIPVFRILAWAFVFYLIIHGIFSPPAETIIAIMASLGIAVGFASQDIFKNIFGGIMIIFDRPFQVGDKIEIDGHYGEVLKIGLRSTRIVTGDDSVITIPNGDLMSKSVSNSNSGEPNCQVVAELYLPIDVDTEEVRQIAIEAAQVSRYVYLNKPIAALFSNELKEDRSYLKMRLKAYVLDIRYEFAFKSDMTEIVMRELISKKIIRPEQLN
jgi:small-conductance mechanosensitive channel